MMGKIVRSRLMSAIVGSYPKPPYLFARSGRELLDEMGMTLYDLAREIGPEAFAERLDRAALMAIQDQNQAGIDFVTDGEERRGHYVLYVLRRLAGIDFEHLTPKPIRESRYVRRLPTVTDQIAYVGPILVDDFEFTRQHAMAIPKIGLPGPTTVVDSVADAYYGGDRERMARDYAQAIRHEVENLIQAGCRAIQFDDPVLLRYPEQAKQWGMDALQACFAGLEDRATFFVHICRGYPDKPLERLGIEYKARAHYYADVLRWVSESTLDVVSIEGAQGGPSSPEGQGLDLAVLPAIGAKTVMLGVLDVGSDWVESVGSLVERGQEALRYLPPEQLILAPDCGMLQLTREAAKRKLANLARAAWELGGRG
jgi:5-methyltetrahydropteroyltriglutamate--homocysteine methyltransferase